MTSATLSSLGSFDRLQAMTGLPDGARYKRVESPFNTQQAVFSIPLLHQEPSDADAHTAEIIDLLPSLVAEDLGVLVLFSSRRQMDAVVMGLEGALPHRLLVQDSLSKSLLLETHRELVDEGKPSVIMGLASFAEGVDLPGPYCTHVVIAKLPFAVPDNPRDAAHAELLEQQGRNAFMEISVPDAALKLVQASGRLLRTEEDSGRITLLDRRLLTRRYGRAILDSLPRYHFNLPAVPAR
jgi:ATP-dependent DNA helicase DinG